MSPEKDEWPPHDDETYTLSREKGFASISVYATTMTNIDEPKEKFYENFEYVISALSAANLSFLVTLMQELDKILPPGKEYCVNTGPEKVSATTYCFFRPALSIIF